VTLNGRLDKIAAALPADPNAPPPFLVVREDAAGQWWPWDDDPATELDPATVHPKTLVVIIGERPDGPL